MKLGVVFPQTEIGPDRSGHARGPLRHRARGAEPDAPDVPPAAGEPELGAAPGDLPARPRRLLPGRLRPPLKAAAVLLGALLLGVIADRGQAQGPYDGEWVVEASTRYGPCQRTYTTPITIRDGVLSGVAMRRAGRYVLSGTVSPDGRVTWTSSGGTEEATFQGTFTGDAGQGDWTTSSGCRGTMTIRRP
jgi:hypothetical protein